MKPIDSPKTFRVESVDQQLATQGDFVKATVS